MNETPRIFLKKNEEKEVRQGFPWVYDNEIGYVKYAEGDGGSMRSAPLSECGVEDGICAEVYTSAGGFVGCGILNKKSKIAVRIISRDHADKVMADTAGFWDKRVRDAVNIRRLNFSDSESCRLVYGESDFIPGLIVERYVSDGKVFLVVQFLALACEVFRREILSSLKSACRPCGIYERSDFSVREKEGLPERKGWIGQSYGEILEICENGVRIAVDIANGQKTGYFLDQKLNRAKAASLCRGKKVLDCFTHTGAFGLNAAMGGAREVVSVDISGEAVEMVRRNILLNGMQERMRAECRDVFELLKEYEETGEKFDVIILDPPAFTKSARMIQKAYGGYKEINLRAMRILGEGGILVSCSCSAYFDESNFYSMITHAARDSHKRVQILEKRGAAPDHPVLAGYPRSEYLKCAVCRVLS